MPDATADPVDFLRDVRPIFELNCFRCHGRQKQESNFRLDRRAAALKGGDLGTAIEPGNSAESPLVLYVAGLDDDLKMPPAGEPLSTTQIGILRRWIDDGADWPDAAANENGELDARWWSLEKIVRPEIPTVGENASWIRTPIDSFVLARLQNAGLSVSGEADRRTLIRRLTFDLHGLPPLPEDVQEFLSDVRADAYERLVDRLLASPRYGERWARHWLDVVHYADSHGQDQDRPRPNAWPYRDYLIRALNTDLPYAQFVVQQVAGDMLYPNDPLAITATGFLAAGPWDESSLRDIREDSIDRLIGQNLDRDDIVTNTTSTFIGLTVGCARCHDHKFDPVSQQDYYAFQALFAGIDKAERSFDEDPAVAHRRVVLQRELAVLDEWAKRQPSEVLTADRLAELAVYEDSYVAINANWKVLEPAMYSSQQGSILKALLDRSLLSLGRRPDKDTYSVTLQTDLQQVSALRLELLADETLPMNGPGRQDNGNLHLSELRIKLQPVGDADQSVAVSLKSAVADFDQSGWGVANAIDGDPATAWGIHPQVGVSHVAVFEFREPLSVPSDSLIAVELDQLHGSGHLIGRFRVSATSANVAELGLSPVPEALAKVLSVPRNSRTEAQNVQLITWLNQQKLLKEIAALPAQSKVYCGTNQFAPDGTFRPAAVPREVHVLSRGEINRPQEVAAPRLLGALYELSKKYEPKAPEEEGQRRAALAGWMVDAENPLTWRVIVNRVWHYHFGRGIVDTPNDFGKMGGLPSHPELLDWLAADFRDSGGSLKRLHRMIVTSSVYRQTSEHNELAAQQDRDNRLLWRMSRQRLDAESVRDGLLQISGQLDLTMFGPPAMQFKMSPGIHVTPNVDYLTFDIDSPESRRRSIYRFIFRTLPDPWLDALDCPDASQSAPVRGDSVGAIQALALWNNKLILRQAEHLALLAEQSQNELAERVRFVSDRVLCRVPTFAETAEWTEYARQFGLPNLCRVLLNSSEFLFVD